MSQPSAPSSVARRTPTKKYGGLCHWCGGEYARAGMSRHLHACIERPTGAGTVHHLVVESQWWGDFWLHVAAPPTASLRGLDVLLRNTWLECCGHLSCFEIDGTRFEDRPVPASFRLAESSPQMGDARIGEVLPPGTKFTYEYDYGSTTPLKGRCVRRLDAPESPGLQIVARNLLPELLCDECGEPAEVLELWDAQRMLCDECNDQGEDWEGTLPVVNSPRIGTCGYAGPY